MNDRSDQQRLLDDVLAESSPSDFRTALLGETLRQARRRRHWQRSRRAAGVFGVLFFAAWLVWRYWPEKVSTVQVLAKTPVVKSYQVVETQPFHAEAMATGEFSGVKLISSEATITQVVTSNDGLRFISDEELLTLTGPGKAMLVRTGPHSEELVFAEPADLSNGNPAN